MSDQANTFQAIDLSDLRKAYPTRELLSRPILNQAGQQVGWIEDLQMREDHLAYAIVEVGDFVGAPGRRVVMAFQDLSIVDKEFMLAGATPETMAQLTVYDPGHVSIDNLILPRGRRGVKDAGHIVATAIGEPISGILSDIADGDRR